MEKVKKFLPLILGGIVALVVFFISKKMQKSSSSTQERNTILEKAREAKLVKSILKKTDDEESLSNLG